MKRKICIWAFFVLLLCGCQAEKSVANTPPATPTPAETPTSTQIVSEEPSPELLEQVEFDTENHRICLEAFRRPEGGEFDYILIRGTVTDRMRPGKTIQTFEHTAFSTLFAKYEEYHVEDVNFDGVDDFYYLWLEGTANRYYIFWVWDDERGRYVEQTDLEGLSLPHVDPESKTIGSHARGSAAHFWDAIYGYVDGDLTLLRSLNMGGDWETQEMTVTNYMENYPGFLYSAAVLLPNNWDDPAYDEFMKFYDLDYWGESDKEYHPPEKKLIEQGEYAVGDYTVRLSLFPQENPRIEEGALRLEGAVRRTDAPNAVLQTFSEEMNRGTYLDLHAEDVNFDGLPDFYYKKQNGYNEEFSFWLFGPNQGRFYRDRMLSEYSNPTFDIENQVVSTFHLGHFGAYARQFVRWENGALKRLRIMRVDEGKEDGWHDMYVLDYPNGEETEVFRTEGRLVNPEEGAYQDRMGDNVSDEFYSFEDPNHCGK